MRHIIYKITNKVNGKYYIGRHSTADINDNYMGSGVGIKNAIRKYGRHNFTKEILAEASTSQELWELEKQYVNESVVVDKNSYNMCVGGKHYLMGLTQVQLKQHQSSAGKIGAAALRKKLAEQGKLKDWHAQGGKKSVAIRNERYVYKIVTNFGETLTVNANEFKSLCKNRGWNYNTLAWKICNGPKTIKRGPLTGFRIEQVIT